MKTQLFLCALIACLSSLSIAQETPNANTNDFRFTQRPEKPVTSPAPFGSEETLPNRHGQVWRKYDIRPYTQKLTDHEHPEQAIIDWILRETGTDHWFREPLGLLSANRNTLSVYHTPATHAVVSKIVDRFVLNKSEAQV